MNYELCELWEQGCDWRKGRRQSIKLAQITASEYSAMWQHIDMWQRNNILLNRWPIHLPFFLLLEEYCLSSSIFILLVHYIKLNQRGLENGEEEGDRQRRETEIGLKHFDGKKRERCLNERKVIRAFGYTDWEWRGIRECSKRGFPVELTNGRSRTA